MAWDGCRDYSSALSLPRTVDLWKSIGVDKVKSYTNDLNLNALEVLRDAWGNNGGGHTLAPVELHGPMTLVALPTTSSFSSTPSDGIARVAIAESGLDTITVAGEVERIVIGIPEGGNHWRRTLRFGPDGALYLTVVYGNADYLVAHQERPTVHDGQGDC